MLPRLKVAVCGGMGQIGCDCRKIIGLPGIFQILHLTDWNIICLRLKWLDLQ